MSGVGAEVGNNLIDGHAIFGSWGFEFQWCRSWQQPDRRTLGWADDPVRRYMGAEVGNNLIDGHTPALPLFAKLRRGAEVGNNLIDGHNICPLFSTTGPGCRSWQQPDRRTLRPLQLISKVILGAEVGNNLIDGHVLFGEFVHRSV